MAVTQISICNSALIKIGCDRISSIGENKKSAILLNALWDQVRDSILRAHPWNFAIKRVALTPNGNTPAYDYDYEYDLPNDYLRLLDPDLNDIDFVVEDSKMLTNESTINMRYIYRNEDESSWDACFAECFAWRLAKEIAYAMTQSAALVELCEKSYAKALAEARSMDGAEGTMHELSVTTWTDARR
jgi:hypothetical protein